MQKQKEHEVISSWVQVFKFSSTKHAGKVESDNKFNENREKLKEREDKASVKKDRSSQEGQGQFLTKTENTVRTREVEELLETQKKMSQRELAVWVWG